MVSATTTELPPVFFVDRSDRGRLRLTGRDRQPFLQGMVTNDVARLKPGEGCYAFQCDATGHVLSDLRVLCTEDALLLDVEPGMAAQVAATLDRYLIMERVKIADVTDDTAQLFVGGAKAPELLAEIGIVGAAEWAEGQNAPFSVGGAEVLLAATRLVPAAGFTLYLYNPSFAAALDDLKGFGAVELSAETLEALRIEAGVPRYGADIDAKVLAPETGQQARAISYKKGCYIGQEIVARIDARGHTNRGFVGLYLDAAAPLPEKGAPIVAEGKEVGRVTSAALSPTLGRPIALGYLRNEHAAPGTTVEVGGTPAQVAALPFVGGGE
jgi:tRNA-modifying protein YgfZ